MAITNEETFSSLDPLGPEYGSINQPTLFEFGSKNVGKIYKTSFKLFIEDFYMTSNLCQSSKTMAKASELLRSYSNNYKFLTWASINK